MLFTATSGLAQDAEQAQTHSNNHDGKHKPSTFPYKNMEPPTKAKDTMNAYYNERPSDQPQPWTHEDHFRAAIKIAPVWFFANFSYYASLEYTSITSSTVLISTGSLFAFLFAVLSKDEKFGWIKLCGVLLGFSGSMITTFADYKHRIDNCTHHCHPEVLGDILGLTAALGYGAYAVQTRVLCPRDESLFSMQILLGYIGLICMITLSPIVFVLFYNGLTLTPNVFLILVTVGFFDNVLFDYLWLRAVMLTNATVASVGLGLTIPMAILVDLCFENQPETAGAVIGALTVLIGFAFANLGNEDLQKSRHPAISEELIHCDNPFDDRETGYSCPSDTYSQRDDMLDTSSESSSEGSKRDEFIPRLTYGYSV